MRAGSEVVIGPDEDESREAEAEHEQLAAGGGLVAGRLAGIGRLGGFGGFWSHNSIQV